MSYLSKPRARYLLALLPAALSLQAAVVGNVDGVSLAFTSSSDPLSAVRFSAHGNKLGVELSNDGAVLTLNKTTLPLRVVGASHKTLATAAEKLPGTMNFLIGNDPTKWRKNVPTFGKVAYNGVLPGINLVYYGNAKRLEYDFEVSPGADPKQIAMEVGGGWKGSLNKNGDLVLENNGGSVEFAKPVTYQVTADGRRVAVESAYVLQDRNRFGFRVGKYDTHRKLVIDPVLAFGTYYGSNSYDIGHDIAVDSSGNVSVVGSTLITTNSVFPVRLPTNSSDERFERATESTVHPEPYRYYTPPVRRTKIPPLAPSLMLASISKKGTYES